MSKKKKKKEKRKMEENWQKYLTLTENFFISSERSEEIQRNFQERYVWGNIKSHKRTGFHPLYRRCIFEKTT